MREYIILSSYKAEILMERVNKRLILGWKCQGGVSCGFDGTRHFWAQTMVR